MAKYTLDLIGFKASFIQDKFESLTIDTLLKYYYLIFNKTKKQLKTP